MVEATGFTGRCRAHLVEANESYFHHLRFASGIGGSLIVAGAACLLHGLIPALFTDKASRTVIRIHNVVKGRKQQAGTTPAQHWIEFEI